MHQRNLELLQCLWIATKRCKNARDLTVIVGQRDVIGIRGVERAGTNEWLLRVVEARASWDLGRRSEAKKSAALAVFKAPSEGKAKNLREYLAEILGSAVDTP